MVEGGFVGGGGDRFHLEGYRVKAGVLECGGEALLGERIILGGLGSNEADGPADGGMADGGGLCAEAFREMSFGTKPEIGEDTGDEVFEGIAAAEDLGTGEGGAGQVGLEGLDEAAGGRVVTFVAAVAVVAFRVEITLDCGGTGEALDAGAARLTERLKVEDGAEGVRRACRGRERNEVDRAIVSGDGDGAVGGAEVDTDADAYVCTEPGAGTLVRGSACR